MSSSEGTWRILRSPSPRPLAGVDVEERPLNPLVVSGAPAAGAAQGAAPGAAPGASEPDPNSLGLPPAINSTMAGRHGPALAVTLQRTGKPVRASEWDRV